MFFRDLFASLCFIFFGFALATQHPYLFFGAMMCGCLALTAKKKQWPNPSWSDAIYDKFENWVYDKAEGPQREFSDGDKIKPLPPLDDKK